MIYFAYGSNLNKRVLRTWCPNARYVGKGFLDGWQLVFRKYLTIEKAEENDVPIGIWDIPDSEIAKLDEYEGYPDLYRKEEMEIAGMKGIIYIMNENMISYLPPSLDYYQKCLLGYLGFSFDTYYLTKAVDTTVEKIVRKR